MFDRIRFYHGPSMEPTFRPGDILHIEKITNVRDLRPGDIIVFQAGSTDPASSETAHRIIRSTPRGFITRGDLNPLPDERPVRPDEVIGRVARIERAGRIHKVRGGRLGLWPARARWALRAAGRLIAAPLKPLYRRLRQSGLVAALWKPDIRRVRFCSPEGDYVEYTYRGRIVGVWRPARNERRFKKPFDLVLWQEVERERKRDPKSDHES